MHPDQLSGVLAASLTPLRPDYSIDHSALAEHCAYLLETGCEGVLLFGTTGEAVSFTREERMRAIEAVLERGLSPERLMLGTGCCAPGDTVALTRHAVSLGLTRILVLPPFYYKNVPDEGLIDSYRRIIIDTAQDRLRLFFYHFPRLTGVPIPGEVVGRLQGEFPGVVAGIKDSSGDARSLGEFCGRFPGLAVYTGTERLLLEGLQAGAAGCISGSANVTSAMCSTVYRSWLAGSAEAGPLQDRLSRVRGILDEHPLIPALKSSMCRRTGRPDWLLMRPPLRALPAAKAEEMMRGLSEFGLFSR